MLKAIAIISISCYYLQASTVIKIHSNYLMAIFNEDDAKNLFQELEVGDISIAFGHYKRLIVEGDKYSKINPYDVIIECNEKEKIVYECSVAISRSPSWRSQLINKNGYVNLAVTSSEAARRFRQLIKRPYETVDKKVIIDCHINGCFVAIAAPVPKVQRNQEKNASCTLF